MTLFYQPTPQGCWFFQHPCGAGSKHAGKVQIIVHLNDSMFTPEVTNCIKNLVVIKYNFGRGAWKAKELKY